MSLPFQVTSTILMAIPYPTTKVSKSRIYWLLERYLQTHNSTITTLNSTTEVTLVLLNRLANAHFRFLLLALGFFPLIYTCWVSQHLFIRVQGRCNKNRLLTMVLRIDAALTCDCMKPIRAMTIPPPATTAAINSFKLFPQGSTPTGNPVLRLLTYFTYWPLKMSATLAISPKSG